MTRDESVPPLNLSATVSPEDFATRFGHLFNTWVSLGYCPQCKSDVLAGNDTVIPSTLQLSYRQATATAVVPGAEASTINWPSLAVFLLFSALLLGAGIVSAVLESLGCARAATAQKAGRTSVWAGVGGGGEGGSLELQLPETCPAVYNSQRSTQWAKGLMQDMEAAVEDGHTGRIYR